jgi:hypothetical protein
MAGKSGVLGGSVEVTNFSDIKNCPECGSLWHDTPIPEESQHHFGGSKWFSRVIYFLLGVRIVVMPGNVQTVAPLGTVLLAPSLTTTKLTLIVH